MIKFMRFLNTWGEADAMLNYFISRYSITKESIISIYSDSLGNLFLVFWSQKDN